MQSKFPSWRSKKVVIETFFHFGNKASIQPSVQNPVPTCLPTSIDNHAYVHTH